MSLIGDMLEDVGRVFKLVWIELTKIAEPWKLDIITDAAGVPSIGGLSEKIAHLAARDIDPQYLADSLAVIQGIHDAIAIGVPDADHALEAVLRVCYPLLLAVARRAGDQPNLIFWLVFLGMLDDKLAASVEGFTAERVMHAIGAGLKAAFENKIDNAALAIPMVLPIATWGLLHSEAIGTRLLNGVRPGQLYAGWESDLLDASYGVPEAWRPTPVWMAQRTSSIHWTPKYKFKLDRYNQALSQPEPASRLGFTLVPIPKKRIYAFPPTPDGPEPPFIADPKGPAMWFQLEGELAPTIPLGRGWQLLLHLPASVGMAYPLDANLMPDEIGGSLAIEAELRWTPTAPTGPPPGDDIVDISLAGASVIGFAGGGVSTGGGGIDDAGVALRLSKLQLNVNPPEGVIRDLLGQRLTTTLDLGLMWSRKRGLALEGTNGLDLYLQGFGVPCAGLTISYLRVTALYTQQNVQTAKWGQEVDTVSTQAGVQVTLGASLSAFGITIVLDGLGAKLVASSTEPTGNLFGLGGADLSYVLPTGLGIKVDLGGFQGGGFFSYDKTLDRYAGAIDISVGGRQSSPAAAISGTASTPSVASAGWASPSPETTPERRSTAGGPRRSACSPPSGRTRSCSSRPAPAGCSAPIARRTSTRFASSLGRRSAEPRAPGAAAMRRLLA